MQEITKKRYGILAIFMSLISPGMGHLYVGRWKLAISFPVILLLIPVIMGWTGLIFLSYGLFVMMLVVAIFYLFVIGSSFQLARNVDTHVLNTSQRWYFYILFFAVVAFINSMLVDYRGKLFGFEPFRLPAQSMLPTLMINDYLIVDTQAYLDDEPDLGDVIVFTYPKDPKIKYVKRVVGKAGDHLKYYNKMLYLNGTPVIRELVGPFTASYSPHRLIEYNEYIGSKKFGITLMPSRVSINSEIMVPEGHYFVLGDNRDNSNDSRYWGVLSHDDLYGKAEYIWLSFDSKMNVRSDRLGLRL